MTDKLKEKIKRRARRIFTKIDEGEDPSSISQHKLRKITQTKLYYTWKGEQGIGFVRVQRDCLGRIYVKQIDSIPA